MAVALRRLERPNQCYLRGLADCGVERVGPLLFGSNSRLGLLHCGHERSALVKRVLDLVGLDLRDAVANVHRQIFEGDAVAFGQQDRALNRMPQLADVAGPWMRAYSFNRSARNQLDVFAEQTIVMLDKM